MNRLAGVSGTLFPGRYVADRLEADAAACGLSVPPQPALGRRLRAWWRGVEASCGPASGLRALCDRVAMPLAAMLGFRASHVEFGDRACRAHLETRAGTPVALRLLPWSARPSTGGRDIAADAKAIGAAWGFVLAPPFLSVIHTRGHAIRRAVDFTVPLVIDGPGLASFATIAGSAAFDPGPGARGASASVLEHLVARAAVYQAQVRRDLQHGVARALSDLAPVVAAAGERRASSGLRLTDEDRTGHDQALTVVYRVLFLLFAESRDLVPHDDPIYRRAYAMTTLCRDAMADRPIGLWDGLAAATRLARIGCRASSLQVAAFNGPLFARAAAPALERARRPRPARVETASASRHDGVQRALVALASRPGRAGREPISFRDLGVEQLGAIYERVLDLDPPGPRPSGPTREAADPPRDPGGRPAAGHSRLRKQTGTFYTPQALTEFVVRRTLAPLVAGASTDAILALRVLDPAMGSGAFLVAACRYLAAAYERALVDEGRAAVTDIDEDARARIRRLVAERCLAGVDRNPTAVHLARLSLWLTTLARDRPLTFLDHRLRVGDSLIGAWPGDLERLPTSGRPAGALPLFDGPDVTDAMHRAARPFGDLIAGHDDTLADVRAKEALWRQLLGEGSPLTPWRQALTLWCARWFWPAGSGTVPDAAETRALLAAILRRDRALPADHVSARLAAAAHAGRTRGFFHWPLEFADVFYDAAGQPRAAPGFDAVLGNPPWEMVRRDPDSAPRSPDTTQDALLRFVRHSGAYPSCDRGHLNLYQPFVDRALTLTRRGGRLGLVLPWGFASDDGAVPLRRRVMTESALDTVVGLDNARALFPIHRGMRFIVVVARPGARGGETRARFGVQTAEDLDALPAHDQIAPAAYPVRLTPERLETIGGPARRIPDVRRPRDLPWIERIASRWATLGDRHGWAASFGRELNATEARRHFSGRGLPVVEGKHVSPFEVEIARPAWRIDRDAAARLLPDLRFERARLGYRDVSAVTNRTTLIAAVVPAGVVTTHTVFCLTSRLAEDRQHALCALLNSYVLNAIVRVLMGGHLTTTLVEGLPAPPWRDGRSWRGVAALARRLAAGPAPPVIAARLQARVARMYAVSPSEFRAILETFPLIASSDRALAARVLDRYSRATPEDAGELIG
jgi:hypothetical protein